MFRLKAQLLLVSALGASCLPILAQDGETVEGWQTDFSTPPYTLGSSILGVEGWESGGKTPAEKMAENCVVVAGLPGNPGSVLRLQRVVPVATQVARPLREPIGGSVQIRTRLSFEIPIQPHATRTTVLVPTVGELSFGIEYSKGLFYEFRPPDSEELRQVVFLKLDEILEGEVYEMVLTIHLEDKRFAFEASGSRADGTKLHYGEADLEYERKSATRGRFLESIGLWSTAAAQNVTYISRLSAQPLPGT